MTRSSPDRPTRAAARSSQTGRGLPSPPRVGLAVLDPNLHLSHVNAAFARLAGAPSAAECVGRRIDDVFDRIDPAVIRSLTKVAEGRKRRVSMEIERPPATGPTAGAAPRTWRITFQAEHDAPGRLVAISAVATDVTAVRRYQQRTRAHRAFQDLLIDISCAFATLPPGRVDAAIEAGLRQLVEFLGVQRAALSHVDRAGRLVVSHSYSAPGSAVMPSGINVDEAFPWLAAALRRGQTVRMGAPPDLPPEAARERAWFDTAGVRAHLSIPFAATGLPLCVLSACSPRDRRWPTQVVPRLRLAGTIFANALAAKRAAEDLQRTRDSLAHMVRVTTMGQLATSIAHELNQPLCAMVGNAQAAIRFAAAPRPDMPEVRDALAEVVRDGKRAGEVIARTHAMLKRHDVPFTPQDVNALVKGVRPLADNYAMIHHVQIKTDLTPDLPPVQGHGVQLQQVITNLLINAVDAIPPDRRGGGRVVISTALDPKTGRVVVRVTDDGVGLPPGDPDRIFQPFFTSKPAGLGMGLNISRTIVDAHGGRIWAQRNPDRGATIAFAIPPA